ncbi:MAG: LytTR family DNA-binding domain-containing protein [Niameybacter sp.]|uniref:LytR/AlgR family response regulator transcription factor n=1 Tax=Niameybacter sp. TaxID=2033640 RepID=UPI002FCC1FF0
MYKIAICEDQKVWHYQLIKIFEQIHNHENIDLEVDTYLSGEALLNSEFNQYDVLILDIQMDGLDGIEVAKKIRKVNERVQIMFVTALENSWSEGYVVRAYRYIVKPIEVDAFYEMMVQLFDEINQSRRSVLVKEDGGMKKVEIASIKYLAIESRKVVIYTLDGCYKSSISLGEWNDKLQPFGFAHPHTSYLVNLKYVKHLNREKIVLTQGDILYVSQRKYKKFKEQFMNYVDYIK